MSFKFIDYSGTYFTTIAKKPIPTKRGGKFVQIINYSIPPTMNILHYRPKNFP